MVQFFLIAKACFQKLGASGISLQRHQNYKLKLQNIPEHLQNKAFRENDTLSKCDPILRCIHLSISVYTLL